MKDLPFEIGERVSHEQLIAWEDAGSSEIPGRGQNALRRFRKGDWVLELRTHRDPVETAHVVAIHTIPIDDERWSDTRSRLMRHRHG